MLLSKALIEHNSAFIDLASAVHGVERPKCGSWHPQAASIFKGVLFMASQSIIHLSDLHIGESQKETVHVEKVVKTIKNYFPGLPVLITGDITNSAEEHEFLEAEHWINLLAEKNPVLMVPGNHDYCWWGNFFQKRAWNLWRKHLGKPRGLGNDSEPWLEEDSEPKGIDGLGIRRYNGLVFIGVDSGDPKNKVPCARGFISPKMAKGIAKTLVENEGSTRVVFLHHHPFSSGLFTELDGSELLIESVKKNCELLLFGHEHYYGVWRNFNEIPLTVASHKTTSGLLGPCLAITLIDIDGIGQRNVSLQHRLHVV